MWSLLRGDPDVVIRWCGPFIIGGMLLGIATDWLQLPGVVTAMFAISLGASGGSLLEWRSNRGLWMLASFFLLVYVAIYGLLVYGRIRDIARGAPPPDVGLMIDFALGTVLLSVTVRFLWRVSKYNWAFSRDSDGV